MRGAATAAKAPAVAAATVAAVAFTLVAAGPALAAAQAQAEVPASAPAAAAKVKYYVVPPPGRGSVPALYSIAAATLGNGSLFMEIFNLNKGRLQPNGQRLEDPHSVEPGWILLLPADASGRGVHFGPLPTGPKATSRVVHRHTARSRATAAASPAAASAGYGPGTITETVIGGALLVFAVAGLGLVLRRRRRSGGSRRRQAHAIQAGPSSDWIRSLAAEPRTPRATPAAPAVPTMPPPVRAALAGLTPTIRAGQRATPDRRSAPPSATAGPPAATAGTGPIPITRAGPTTARVARSPRITRAGPLTTSAGR